MRAPAVILRDLADKRSRIAKAERDLAKWRSEIPELQQQLAESLASPRWQHLATQAQYRYELEI